MIALVVSHRLMAWTLLLAEVAPAGLPAASVESAVAPAPEDSASPNQGTGAAAPADARRAAQAVLAAGNQSLKSGDVAGAIADYRRAQTIYPPAAAKIEFNIAKAEQERHNQVAAAAAFDRFLSQSPDSPAEFHDEARAELGRLAEVLGALRLAEKRPGLLVEIDGQVQGTTPVEGRLWVHPGRRVVTVKDGGRITFRETIDVSVGATVALDVSIQTRAAPAPERNLANGTLRADYLRLVPTPRPALGEGLPGPPAGPMGRPIWKKWWFWTAGAAVLAGTAAAILILADRCPAHTDCMAASLGSAP